MEQDKAQVDQREVFIRFVNEFTNNMKNLSREKFDKGKLEVVEKGMSYYIDRAKDNDVDVVIMACIFSNVLKLFVYNNSLDRLGAILDQVFQQEVVRGIRTFDVGKGG